MRLDDSGQAEDSFRRAIALNPRDANAHAQLRLAAVPAEPLCRRAARSSTRRCRTPSYADRAKTLMTQGVCQLQAGQRAEAERSLTQAYELDAGQPGHRLQPGHRCCTQRDDWTRAQFYIRRVNNSQSANAETLWLGIKIERRLNDRVAHDPVGASQLQQALPPVARGSRVRARELSMIERAAIRRIGGGAAGQRRQHH